jgi:uncharacterized RDD family membrane protein YckC
MSDELSIIKCTPGARLGAFLMDALLSVVTLGIGWLIWSLIVWQKGTTPGHQVLKQKIVDEQTGETFTWGRMALRELVFKGIVIGVGSIFTLGILWVVDSLFVVREDRKTIHDMMSRSLVVNA